MADGGFGALTHSAARVGAYTDAIKAQKKNGEKKEGLNDSQKDLMTQLLAGSMKQVGNIA